jgi:pantoate--beta-alanine ligase
MIIFKTIEALQRHLNKLRANSRTIGFAPTMGALHAGHLALVQQSKEQCSCTVVSIFVNPTQFNDPKDFEKYPVTIENDLLLLEKQQTNILFLPSVSEMYPNGTRPSKHYNLGELENLLEGRYRPGHFQGVCQVVERLLEIVQPNQLFLGQKDYQQCMVLNRLVEEMNAGVQLQIVPTVREPDGLAMSSRNLRLSSEQRGQATAIYQELISIRDNYMNQEIGQLEQNAAEHLLTAGFRQIDYVSIADAATLQPLTEANKNQKAVALVAAFMGEVRLIDNLLLN